jgi:hypothetical protein
MATTKRYEVSWDDHEIESGGNPSPGWYGARLESVEEDFERDAIRLRFEITTPDEFRGRKVNDTLWSPQNAKDEESAKRTMQRNLLVAKRLGLLPPEGERRDGIEIDWLGAIGKEVYLRVTQRDSYLQPEFSGVFAADDPRVPEQVRQGHATPLTVKPLAVKEEKAGKARPAKPAGIAGVAAAANSRPHAAAPAKPAPEDWSNL